MSGFIDTELWRSLAAMRIEPEGAALTFAARLARENRWSADHAASVVEEYRRFLYLAATSASAVTPSDDVDRAWHLHLAYSRHYWDELCGRILTRPLHHGPTEGGRIEDDRYLRQYEATLAAYRATFGEAPPAAVWPDPATRFAVRPVTIDAARSWVVPKATGGRMAVVGGTMLLAACGAITGDGQKDAGFIAFVLTVLAVFWGAVFLVESRRRRRRGRRGGGGDGCGSAEYSSNDSDGSSGCGGGGCGGGD